MSRNIGPIAIAVDLLEACRQRRNVDLLDLYEDDANAAKAAGSKGRLGLRSYWTLRLSDQEAETS
jgi:hypothetical protein